MYTSKASSASLLAKRKTCARAEALQNLLPGKVTSCSGPWSTCPISACCCAGEKLSESTAGDVRELCTTLLNCYLIQLLETGFLHADPHPGNLIRTPEGQICILDFGLMTEVSCTPLLCDCCSSLQVLLAGSRLHMGCSLLICGRPHHALIVLSQMQVCFGQLSCHLDTEALSHDTAHGSTAPSKQ